MYFTSKAYDDQHVSSYIKFYMVLPSSVHFLYKQGQEIIKTDDFILHSFQAVKVMPQNGKYIRLSVTFGNIKECYNSKK